MKRILYTGIFILFAALTLQAQDKGFDTGSITDTPDNLIVEDSDGITRSDYYSNELFVRSASETYTVETGEPYYSDLKYAVIKNTSNKYLWKPAYFRATCEKIPQGELRTHRIDLSYIVKQVLPKCVIKTSRDMKNQQSMFIYMAVDPDTEKVIEVSFTIDSFKSGTASQNTIFSLPPSKLRQLEELIKGNVSVKLHELEKGISYSKAVSNIYFTLNSADRATFRRESGLPS